MIFIMSLMGSLFICSFSSVLSAVVLIFFTLILLGVMYWNMMSVVPLYLFSLFTLGGLYVLLGFTMMADIRDLDMIFDTSRWVDLLLSFVLIFLGLNIFSHLGEGDLGYYEFSYMKSMTSMTSFAVSSMFIFLILLLLVFLFIMYIMIKGSLGGGGFVSDE